MMNLAQKVILRAQTLYLSTLDDESYAKTKYRWKFGRELHLDNPLYFSEKIQWLKLYDDNDGHAAFADKFAVRNIVSEGIGAQYLNELYFAVSHPDEIDFASLPNSFVLKATHGSGFNLICPDKDALSPVYAKARLNRWLSLNYARKSRERQYEHIEPRIICEKFLDDGTGSLRDYKILCFAGEPKLIWVDIDRYNGHKRSFFTPMWEPLPVTFNKYPCYEGIITKPKNLDEMLRLSKEMSRGFPFCRVDFYSVGGQTIFGEVTFHPASGFAEFAPLDFSLEVGSWIPIDRLAD